VVFESLYRAGRGWVVREGGKSLVSWLWEWAPKIAGRGAGRWRRPWDAVPLREVDEPLVDPWEDPTGVVDGVEVRAAVERLPARMQSAVWAHGERGAQAELARVEGVTRQAVSNRTQRGLEILAGDMRLLAMATEAGLRND
jgi:DNA-directed RNA polymerase specialized sigma24 family protein